MDDKHTHKYTDVELLQIKRVQKNYEGTAGDKSILVRTCTCGKQKAFEIGNTKDMEELLAKIKKG
jgi:hypothetical protein